MGSGFLKYIFFFFLFFFLFQRSFAQTEINNYNVYSTKQGLSSNLIHDLVIDSKGFLWIATANGLNRFDGNRFRQYSDLTDTLAATLDVLSIGLDSLGEIFCASRSKYGLINYHNSKWYKYPFLNLFTRTKSLCIGKILFDKNYIWILTTAGELIKYDKLTNKTLFYNTKPDINYRINFYVHNNELIFNSPKWTNGISLIHCKANSDFLSQYDTLFSIDNPNIIYKNFIFDNNGNIYISFYIKNSKGDYIKMVQFYNRYNHSLTKLYKVNGNINLFDITISKDGKLLIIDLPFVKVFDKNLSLINEFYINIPENIGNNQQQIMCSIIDNYENLWIGTDLNGLIKINLNSCGFKNYIFSYDKMSNYIRSLLSFNNDLFIGSKNGNFFRMNKQLFSKSSKIKCIPELIDDSEFPVNCIGIIDSSTIAYQKNFHLYFYNQFNRNKYNSGIQIVNNFWTFWSDYKNNIWFGTIRNGLYHFMYKSTNIKKRLFINKNLSNYPFSTVVKIFEDFDKNLWIATDIGLIYFNKEKSEIIKVYQSLNKETSRFIAKDIWQIYEEKPGYIWIGSTDGGLSCLEKNSGKITNYLQKDGLPNNTISGILPDNNGNLWIGTISGLSKFNLSERSFTNYDEDDGLLASDFNFNACSRSDDGIMFWGTKKGIVYFHPDSIHKVRGPLAITSVRVNDREIKTELFNKDTLVLKHNENIFSFEFAILDFSNPSKWNLEYMLVGFDKNWKKALLFPPSATYTNIPPGHYNFRIRTANFDEHHNRKEIEILVIVEPAFWQTTWFYIIIGIFFCIFLIFIFREYQNKIQMKRKLLQVEIDSLRAQMNPHFIFNSLNSIQDFIINNNKEIASFYLAKFAKLMRLILENSKKTTITIEDEIDFLNLYIYLEKMRLNDNLENTIFVDENINIFEDKIPPMLLQPIIENSIKHGLAPKKGKRELSINITKNNNIIKCTITDNGIGREAANSNLLYINKEKSRGSELINNRLSLLSLIYNKDFHFDIEDLIDTNGIPSGTMVVIYIGDNIE